MQKTKTVKGEKGVYLEGEGEIKPAKWELTVKKGGSRTNYDRTSGKEMGKFPFERTVRAEVTEKGG